MPSLTLPSVVLLIAALHSVGLAILLGRRSGEPRKARGFLVGLLAVMAVLLTDMAFQFSGMPLTSVAAMGLVGSLWFAIGPLYYGYVRCLIPERAAWEPEDLVHALPWVLQLFVVAAILWSPVVDSTTLEAGGKLLSFSFTSLYFLQTVTYALATVWLVRGYNARYRQEVAGSADDQLEGLNRLTWLFAVYAGMMTVNMILVLARGSVLQWLDYFVPLALAAIVSMIGYTMLRQPGLVLPSLTLPERPGPEPEPASSPDLTPHAQALRELMETERPYLDPEIRLAGLAKRLGLSERLLSQVLADGLGGSFYDVVNGYRVDEAKARLADPALAHQTVLAIGLDAGFSSKASFNRVFKAQTGTTPSAYRQSASSRVPTLAVAPLSPASGDGASKPVRKLVES
ncbi:MAG: helix-turn-helix transcriptional regulator [Bacteroidota bacterium]